jgi:hypothetical protein
MKSGKRRRKELEKRRATRAERDLMTRRDVGRRERERAAAQAGASGVIMNAGALAPYNSYSDPDFVIRGFYVDQPFRCLGCGKEQIWTGTQQKWWYEVAKGEVYSKAVFCRECRRKRKAGKWTKEDHAREASFRRAEYERVMEEYRRRRQ